MTDDRPTQPFFLIVADYDRGFFSVEGPMADDRPWNDAARRRWLAGWITIAVMNWLAAVGMARPWVDKGVRAPEPLLLESADRIDNYISRLYCRFSQLRRFSTQATHQVENSSAATEEIISNDPSVASPPDGF